jgi:hypothetical protein
MQQGENIMVNFKMEVIEGVGNEGERNFSRESWLGGAGSNRLVAYRHCVVAEAQPHTRL